MGMALLLVSGEMEFGYDAREHNFWIQLDHWWEHGMSSSLFLHPLAKDVIQQEYFTKTRQLNTGKDNVVHVAVPVWSLVCMDWVFKKYNVTVRLFGDLQALEGKYICDAHRWRR